MLFHIFSLILQVAVTVVASSCLLRLYMQLQRINLSLTSGNPLAPFVFATTNWIVLPIRRIIPAIAKFDSASFIAAFLVVLGKYVLLWLIGGAATEPWLLLAYAGFDLANLAISGLMWLVIIYAVLSWLRTNSDANYYLAQLIEPMLRPLRRLLPYVGGIDLSPIVLIVLFQIAEIVLHGLQVNLLS